MPLVFVPPQEQGAARLHALRARRVIKVLHSSEQLRSLLCKDRSSKFQHRREERCRQSQAAFESMELRLLVSQYTSVQDEVV